jgi:hypothetical protein
LNRSWKVVAVSFQPWSCTQTAVARTRSSIRACRPGSALNEVSAVASSVVKAASAPSAPTSVAAMASPFGTPQRRSRAWNGSATIVTKPATTIGSRKEPAARSPAMTTMSAASVRSTRALRPRPPAASDICDLPCAGT